MIRNTLYRGYSLLVKPRVDRLEALSKQPREAQLKKLSQILEANKDSRFGKDHNFAAMQKWSDFDRGVPIRNYEDFSEYIQACLNGEKSVLTREQPFMFASTSGTTGSQKYIPITNSYLKEYRNASIVSGFNLYKHYPEVANGTALALVSSAQDGITAGGIPHGSMTGALYQKESLLVKKYIAPIPYEVLVNSDYQSRYYTVLRIALGMPTSVIYTPNPSTIDLLCRKLKDHGEDLIRDIRDGAFRPPGNLPLSLLPILSRYQVPDPVRAKELESLLLQDQFTPQYIWKNLSLISCWTKAAAAFYLSEFGQYFGQTPVAELTYCASEGRGTVYLGPGQQMLAIDSHYFEFIPEAEAENDDPPILLADQLEQGQNYYILFTTSGGLYRYHLNDVIKVTGFYNRTPLIEFQYKGGNVSSFTGEKITELQVTNAMTAALKRLGVSARYFTLVPSFKPFPHYQLWFEPDLNVASHSELIDIVARQFELELAGQNMEFKAKRESERLGSIKGRLLKKGSYEALRSELVNSGIPDSQVKPSHLNPKLPIVEFLETMLHRDTEKAGPSLHHLTR